MKRKLSGVKGFKSGKESAVQQDNSSYDVIIIGAGGGGLAAAARLSMGGMKVLLMEQHNKVGGYMTNFKRNPYTFEVSLHVVDGLDPGEIAFNTFTELDIIDRIKPIRSDPVYSVVSRTSKPADIFDVPAHPEAYRELLKKRFPHEARGIDRLFNDLESIYRLMLCTGIPQKGDRRVIWTFLHNPGKAWLLMKYMNKTLSEMLADYIHDQRLISLFTVTWIFLACEPDRVSATMFAGMWNSLHRGGYYYFEGGSQSVSDALAEVIRENGGDILLSTRATDILIENSKAVAVQTLDGKEFKCRYVVSNANAPDTFFKMLGQEHLPRAYLRKLESMKICMSVFVVYLGVDHDYKDCFPSGGHELFVVETHDMSDQCRYITEGISEKMDFSITNYSLVDPGTAPEGKNVICLNALMPFEWKNGWCKNQDYASYKALKEEVAWIFIARAEEFLPGLSSHIEVMEVGSPRTMEHYTLNPMGTFAGWDNTPDQSILKRLEQQTPIKNLYLAGAWTYPGGGVSAVLNSGLQAAKMILARDK